MTKKIIFAFVAASWLMNLSLSFFFATYTIFLQAKGLNLMEINLTNLVFMTSCFLLEIPTGAIADLWGRKRSIIAGAIIMAGGFFLYYLTASFWWFILAEIIGAFGSTCISGAMEAWAVDSLKHYNYDGDLEKIFQRREISQSAIIIGCLVGSMVGSQDLALPWLMSASGFLLLALFVAIYFPEKYFSRQNVKLSFQPIKKVAQESIAFGWKNRPVFLVIAFSALMFLAFQPLNMYWNIYSRERYNFSVVALGFLFSGISLAIYLGSLAANWWKKLFATEMKALIFSQIFTGLAIILAGLSGAVAPYLLFFLGQEFGRGLARPLERAYLNRRISSQNRATVLSFASMVATLGGALGLLLSGPLALVLGIAAVWTIAGALIVIIGFLFLRISKKSEAKI